MSDVKRLPERLECMLFRVRFDEEIGELQPVSNTFPNTHTHSFTHRIEHFSLVYVIVQ